MSCLNWVVIIYLWLSSPTWECWAKPKHCGHSPPQGLVSWQPCVLTHQVPLCRSPMFAWGPREWGTVAWPLGRVSFHFSGVIARALVESISPLEKDLQGSLWWGLEAKFGYWIHKSNRERSPSHCHPFINKYVNHVYGGDSCMPWSMG